MKPILPKHPEKISRDVTEKDLDIVLQDGKDLLRLCHMKHGIHERSFAMAHPQIEEKDPLRFFVTERGVGYINPIIIKAVQPHMRREACMSFPNKGAIDVSRFNLIHVEFTPFLLGQKKESIDLSQRQTAKFSALTAAVFQHEIGHFDDDLIY